MTPLTVYRRRLLDGLEKANLLLDGARDRLTRAVAASEAAQWREVVPALWARKAAQLEYDRFFALRAGIVAQLVAVGDSS
jgi:hypothetical protein